MVWAKVVSLLEHFSAASHPKIRDRKCPRVKACTTPRTPVPICSKCISNKEWQRPKDLVTSQTTTITTRSIAGWMASPTMEDPALPINIQSQCTKACRVFRISQTNLQDTAALKIQWVSLNMPSRTSIIRIRCRLHRCKWCRMGIQTNNSTITTNRSCRTRNSPGSDHHLCNHATLLLL